MDCPQIDWLSDKEFLLEFQRRTFEKRVPVSGGINLTNRCNLRCVHCYIRDYDGGDPASSELSTDEVLSIIDQVVDAGCLSFLITGGEPLLHPDFATVYRHARESGIIVSVFTNGTLLDSSHIELFRELPPRQIELTLYGATPETYEAVTGVKGSYDAFHRGIELLRKGDVPFRLKTMLLTLNVHEFALMTEYARELGVRFRFDPLIAPRLDGDCTPLQYRVDPATAVELEMSDEERVASVLEDLKSTGGENGESARKEFLYRCGTGATGFFIDSHGWLQPCMMVTNPSVDLRKTRFGEAWAELAGVRDIPAPPDLHCKECSLVAHCGYCPPVTMLENGMKVEPGGYVCRLGECRKQAIADLGGLRE